MSRIDSAELSALIDGELDAQRARAVQAAIEHDPTLRAEFERMRRIDAACRSAAMTASFVPRVALPGRVDTSSPALVVAAIVMLLVVRFLPKLLGILWAGTLVHAVVLAAAMVWFVRFALRDSVERLDRKMCPGRMPLS